MNKRRLTPSLFKRKIRKLHDACESQNSYEFGSVKISSKFDTGNIIDVKQVSERNFIMTTVSDGEPFKKTNSKAWYHFSITGFETVPEDEQWKFIPEDIRFDRNDTVSLIQFRYQFDCSSTSVVHFCYSFPFGYEDVCKQMGELQERLKDHESIYFLRELAGYSLERRKIELITITDHSQKTEEREPFIRRLFPSCKNRKTCKRGFIFSKPTIFFSSRVHPGEVAASFVLNGILEILTDPDNEYGKLLRKNFVFKIIPLLNPDGVYRGYYRQDTMGNNLNRFYKDPKYEEQPSIYFAKQIINQLNKTSKLVLYIDLHAHASRKGCFMFGNSLNIIHQQVENMALPKVISLNSIDFDFSQCSFAEANMKVKDKSTGLARDGCGRVAIWNDTGIPNSYTLECHYTIGLKNNTLTDIVDVKTGEIVQKAEDDKEQTDPNLVMAGTKENPYTVESFMQIGKAVCVGILDYYELNTSSRIPSSEFRSMKNIRLEMRKLIEERKRIAQINEKNAYNRLYYGGNNKRKDSSSRKADALPPLSGIPNQKCDEILFRNNFNSYPEMKNKTTLSSKVLLNDILITPDVNIPVRNAFRGSSSVMKKRKRNKKLNINPPKIPELKSPVITPTHSDIEEIMKQYQDLPKAVKLKMKRKTSKSLIKKSTVKAALGKKMFYTKAVLRKKSSKPKRQI
ncbi:unnamed protein product [Moneuplotes crassus]|uniref:tubulin-glutamate carboxypeptidase n=1 Tax=Euplotes crassus TaxID=5936 RepID=A0AAD1TZM4_EUPCR|nr:unnamed protein product [Moneuplotes crassus]